MLRRYSVLFSASAVFLLSVLPALLGLHSFYRYEMVSALLRVRTLFPDVSFTSFTNIWQNTFYEYYRPGEYVIWSVCYLIAGDTPFLYQLFQAIIYGLIAVGIYLSARFFPASSRAGRQP